MDQAEPGQLPILVLADQAEQPVLEPWPWQRVGAEAAGGLAEDVPAAALAVVVAAMTAYAQPITIQDAPQAGLWLMPEVMGIATDAWGPPLMRAAVVAALGPREQMPRQGLEAAAVLERWTR